MKIKIIKETDNYLVINKPAGMKVHADNLSRGNDTLVDWLLGKYKEIKDIRDIQDIKGSEIRPGIVHRLDKDVSGVMVIPRTQEMYEHLKKQFQERKIKKEYLALVHKKMRQDEGEVKIPIGRSKSGKLVAQSEKINEGRSAMTKYEVIKKYINYTLLKVEILTGRTHQIRVHLSSIGHPIAGDKLYETHDIRVKKKGIDLGRLWLYSAKLGFKDLNGEWVEYQVAMPEELKIFLDKIK
ncbi:hypothetical protein A3F58_00270 [Candidatus Roizmanbacteria bacterium RIFCSPHIGHO2_12_FULL_37_9b]|uniref:Pseudouridine synthase n=1 Tax=Candidatus Kuenenbacteria bacterium RIFCSPHIGHO2_02_FULL_39_13 TaxID=1798561 RepID=A0A1F6FME0_9BACT|nr:MAG: hypothetical protein A3B87_02150 [Candidatus Kuenenbacteria bacterium RIFCSPHIGHO2_02_FULL_39_13]OGK33288.1 MAG: hypothetical protein A3F58_00270 [Candidatus Roizmanbacteria bacterium RIFCSPHIGHO2_12_FULL_37_9b]